jgi:hypothetical protein
LFKKKVYGPRLKKYALINGYPVSRILMELWRDARKEGETEVDHVDGDPCNNDMFNKFGRRGNLEHVTKEDGENL